MQDGVIEISAFIKGLNTELNFVQAKLIRHVARIAYLNQMNHGERAYPSLGRWLSLVNVTLSEATAIADFVIAIPDLIQLSDRQIVQIADRCHLEPDSRRRFRRSTSNLRRYIQRWEGIKATYITNGPFKTLKSLQYVHERIAIDFNTKSLKALFDSTRGIMECSAMGELLRGEVNHT